MCACLTVMSCVLRLVCPMCHAFVGTGVRGKSCVGGIATRVWTLVRSAWTGLPYRAIPRRAPARKLACHLISGSALPAINSESQCEHD